MTIDATPEGLRDQWGIVNPIRHSLSLEMRTVEGYLLSMMKQEPLSTPRLPDIEVATTQA